MNTLNRALLSKSASVQSIGAHSAFNQHRVLVDEPSPWVASLDKRFNDLTSLPIGWDGYKGVPVLYTVAKFASLILSRLYVTGLPAPSLVPGSDGTLQIEWHINQYDVELDILNVNSIFASRYDCLSGAEESFSLSNDVTIPSRWMHDLVAKRAELAATAV